MDSPALDGFFLARSAKNDWIPETSSGLSHFLNALHLCEKTTNPEGPSFKVGLELK